MFVQASERGSALPNLGETFMLYMGSKEGMQQLVTKAQRPKALEQGHSIPWSGQGLRNTLMHIFQKGFTGPISSEVKEHCKTYPGCSLTNSHTPAQVSLLTISHLNRKMLLLLV